MSEKEKQERLLNAISEELDICDIIIMLLFKKYTIKVYKIGLNDAFYWNNKKYGKNKEIKKWWKRDVVREWKKIKEKKALL